MAATRPTSHSDLLRAAVRAFDEEYPAIGQDACRLVLEEWPTSYQEALREDRAELERKIKEKAAVYDRCEAIVQRAAQLLEHMRSVEMKLNKCPSEDLSRGSFWDRAGAPVKTMQVYTNMINTGCLPHLRNLIARVETLHQGVSATLVKYGTHLNGAFDPVYQKLGVRLTWTEWSANLISQNFFLKKALASLISGRNPSPLVHPLSPPSSEKRSIKEELVRLNELRELLIATVRKYTELHPPAK